LGWTPEQHQLPPEQPWDAWLLIAGRGAGKTDADAHYVDQHASGPACIPGSTPHRIGIIAPTHEDAKKTCVVGDSGLLSHNPDIRFTPGGKAADLLWPNGAVANLFGAFTPEDVERLRGPQHCLIWVEELAAWRYLEQCWDQAQFGLRLGAHPHIVGGTTPKPRPFFIDLLKQSNVAVTRAKTDDNPHLHLRVRAELERKYGGTRLGQQELYAEILPDIEGALWTRAMIAYGDAPSAPIQGVMQPSYQRMVVAIDPAVTYGPDSDETGIVVAAMGSDGLGYLIGDHSGRYPPHGWAKLAVALYHQHKADRIVAESNNGGEMVRETIGTVDSGVPVKLVTATRGKRTRAEPIAALYEQNRIKHLQPFGSLEDQLCNFTPDTVLSPDRLDALVWAFHELMLDGVGGQFSMIA
jgi:phage terminase large subunit-like protein